MVLLPDTKKSPELIGDLSYRLTTHKFKVYYDLDTDIVVTGVYRGENVLFSQIYQEFALIEQEAPVTFQFIKPKDIDTIILGKCSADYIQFEFYNADGELIADNYMTCWLVGQKIRSFINTDIKNIFVKFDTTKVDTTTTPDPNDTVGWIEISRQLAPGASKLDIDDQEVVILQFIQIVDVSKVVMKFRKKEIVEDELIELHKVLFCTEKEFPEPKSFQYPLSVQSTSTFSPVNIVYGKYWPTARVLSMKWDKIDDLTRRDFEEYINDVQNFRPHYILPIGDNDQYLPPMFGVLTKSSIDNEKSKNIWFWSGIGLDYRMCG